MVSLSGFRARALQVGTMSDSSVMYWVILLRRRRSISLWFSLKQREEQLDKRKVQTGTTDQPSRCIGSLAVLLFVNVPPPTVGFSVKWNAGGRTLPPSQTFNKWWCIACRPLEEPYLWDESHESHNEKRALPLFQGTCPMAAADTVGFSDDRWYTKVFPFFIDTHLRKMLILCFRTAPCT